MMSRGFAKSPTLRPPRAFCNPAGSSGTAASSCSAPARWAPSSSGQQPKVWAQAKLAVARAEIEGKCHRLDPEAFAASPKVSIDYAVMENANRIGVVEASFDWNDLGSWNQLHDGSVLDEAGNARFGDVLAIDVANSYLRSEDRLLAVAGLDNIIVVSQPDALLIVHRDKSHLVKDIATSVKNTGEWPPLAVAHSGRPVPSPRVIRKMAVRTPPALPLWGGPARAVDHANGGGCTRRSIMTAARPISGSSGCGCWPGRSIASPMPNSWAGTAARGGS